MKKKVLSLLLAAAMAVSLLPVTAFAASTDYKVWVNNEEFDENKKVIECGSGTATLDASTNPYTLTLNNATITKGYYDVQGRSGAIFSELKALKVVVNGTCKIELDSSDGSNGIGVRNNLTIAGDGTLSIKLKNTGFQGIEALGNVTVAMDGGSLDIDCGQNAICAKSLYVTVSNTSLTVKSSLGKGICAENSDGSITISNSGVTVTSAGDGIMGGSVSCSRSGLNINSGAIGISANGPYYDDGVSFTNCLELTIAGKDAAVQSLNGDVSLSESSAYLIGTDGSAVNLLGGSNRKVFIKNNATPVTFEGAVGMACISPSAALSVENLAKYAVTGGPEQSKAGYARNPAVVVKKSQVGTPAAPAADPVYGTAEDARQLFDFSMECYSGSPCSYTVEWKQGDDTWGASAPVEGLSLSAGGKVSTTETTPAGSYTFRVIANELDPAFASDDAILTVARAVPPLAVSLAGWTYGQSAHTPSVTGNTGNGTVTYSYKVSGADDSTYGTEVPAAAGIYTVRAQAAETANYAAADAAADFTITKADAAVTAPTAKANLTYNGQAQALITAGASADGELQYKLGTDGSYSTAIPTAKDAGEYTVYYKVVGDSNHKDTTEASVAVNIAGKEVTVSGIVVADKVYNGRTDDVTVTSYALTGKADGDELTLTGLAGTYANAAVSDAQTVSLNAASNWTLGGSSKDNYVLATTGQPTATTGKITKAALTITANNKTISYTDAAANDGVQYSGFVNGETEAVLGGTLTYAYKATGTDTDYTVTSPVGAYDIIPGGLTADNYAITFVKGTLTVGAKKLTKPAAVSRTYTYTGDEQTFELSGFDSAVMEISGGTQTNANEAGYTVTVTPKANYAWSADGDCAFTWIIGKAPVTVRANDVSAYVGDTVPDWEESGVTVTGLFNSDSVTGYSLSCDAPLSASDWLTRSGEYDITVTGSEDAAGSNYVVSYENGKLTVSNYPVPAYRVAVADTENGSLNVSAKTAAANTIITVTAVPDAGFLTDAVTVTGSDGSALALTALGDGRYSFRMPSDSVTVSAAFVSEKCQGGDGCTLRRFTDVDVTAWYHDSIHFCVDNGLMIGTSDTKFDPTGDVTRAQIVTILWRLEGEKYVNYAISFEDVAEEQWYTEAVRWAAAEGIVNGYGYGRFGTGDPVSREQLATILYRYAQYKGQGFTGAWMFLLDFTDRADISEWADEAVHWCSMKGVVNGRDDGTFDPQGTAARAEAAAMMQRFCEALIK